ncbi:MAG: acetyl-CoA carboxylase carboxyltransferase subunit alpha [Candidatus Aureabacteria bacterium]|nr:acetyl-CoA carboxylase carboxyltransferase subunit alpha [Candidatus Auribacterota bacterium]
MNGGFDFEKPILELESKIEGLKKLSETQSVDVTDEIGSLQKKLDHVRREIYNNLSPWQRVQIARHPQRPYTLDYIHLTMEGFVEFAGDRLFGNDQAIVGGLARLQGSTVMVVGQQKGRDTKENLRRNFGSAHPEGYRKAQRLMKMAEKFRFPVISFIDTPGAYPGIGAEERGQAEAIASNLRVMGGLKTPIIVTIIGEGGSGGALGIAVGDEVMMLENSYYSVISPEGCAAILWKNHSKAPEAASTLRISPRELLDLGIIDRIIPEPLGGAHRGYEAAAREVKKALVESVRKLAKIPLDELVKRRYDKYRRMGAFTEGQ